MKKIAQAKIALVLENKKSHKCCERHKNSKDHLFMKVGVQGTTASKKKKKKPTRGLSKVKQNYIHDYIPYSLRETFSSIEQLLPKKQSVYQK